MSDDQRPSATFSHVDPYPADEGVLAQVNWWWPYGSQLAFGLAFAPFLLLLAELMRRLSSN